MSKLWIIAKEVYRKNVKSWGFFFLVAGPFLMIAISSLIGYFISREESNYLDASIAIVSQDPGLQDSLKQEGLSFNLSYYTDESVARQAMIDDQVSGYLTVENQGGQVVSRYYQKVTARSLNLSALSEALNHYQLESIGQSYQLNANQIATIRNSRVSIDKINLKEASKGQYQEEDAVSLSNLARTVAAFVAVMLAYIMIVTYSSIFAQEVALEKGSRVMEIILSSIPAKLHLLGKVLGGFLVLLTQMLIYILIACGFYALVEFTHFFDYLVPYKSVIWEVFPIFGLSMVFAFLGLVAYLLLSVLLGSVANRIEDVQKSVQPLILVTIAGFYIALYGLQQPNSAVVIIGSWIPFITPFVMPVRIAADTVGLLEMGFCLVGCMVFMIFAFWLALTFYKATVLSNSDKGVIHAFKRSYSLWKSERQQKV